MRRRSEKKTIPERYVSMREISQQWHAQLNATTHRVTDDVSSRREANNSTQEG